MLDLIYIYMQCRNYDCDSILQQPYVETVATTSPILSYLFLDEKAIQRFNFKVNMRKDSSQSQKKMRHFTRILIICISMFKL